jgi:predicted ATP-grasp superfamily ATP-dependent carboligase
MEGIKVSKKPLLKNPYLIIAWPGMGEVAFKAAKYLVGTLKAEEFARVVPEGFFYLTASVVQEGIVDLPELPSGIFYYWKNPAARRVAPLPSKQAGAKDGAHDLIIFVSNAQPDLAAAVQYSEMILAFAKKLKVKLVVSCAAMPQPIEHTQPPNVWLIATSETLLGNFKKHKLNILSEGQISGMNGLFLGIAKKQGFPGICLLGEIPLYTIQIENPKASYAVLELLSRLLNVQIDFNNLLDQVHATDEEINKLLEYLKVGTPPGPIGEEEIEKIKKSLGQLTKLPASVKEKIEKLFTQAKTDISKAKELKVELDHWNVYKEYEDRFLDLFKKKKGDNN